MENCPENREVENSRSRNDHCTFIILIYFTCAYGEGKNKMCEAKFHGSNRVMKGENCDIVLCYDIFLVLWVLFC